MDLRREFPGIKGFSERNLWNMRSFFDGYKDRLILQQLVAEIPWGDISRKDKGSAQCPFCFVLAGGIWDLSYI